MKKRTNSLLLIFLLANLFALSGCASFSSIVSGKIDPIATAPTPPVNDNVTKQHNNRKTQLKAVKQAPIIKPKNRLVLITDDLQKELLIANIVVTEPEPLVAENVGYYMDVQYAMLQKNLRETAITVFRADNKIIIRLPGKQSFNLDSADFNPWLDKPLLLIADVLREYTKTLVLIEGHADIQEDGNYNQKLSEKRAMAIGNFFVKNKVTPNRLMIMGHGATKPMVSNISTEGRALNRRIELILLPVHIEDAVISL